MKVKTERGIDMTFVPHPQEIYRHFKGNLYQILTLAEHSETGETLVIYQALYGDFKVYARPLGMFTEEVDAAKYPAAGQRFRFELQKGPGAEYLGGAAVEPAGDQELAGNQEPAGGQGSAEVQELDPLMLEFLDADTYEERLKILTALHHRVTHEMLTTMAVACDIEVSEGDLEERYESLRRCLLTLEKYECNRLR